MSSNVSPPTSIADTSDAAWRDAFATAAETDVGMRRASNQDSFCVKLADDREQWQRSGHLLIVADGMGAHAAGELASRLSVELIPHHFSKNNRGDPSQALVQAMQEANEEIYRRGQANPEFRNMGTTTSSLLILPIGAVVGHVGDSRVYRLRGETLEQLTFDHSLVWEMRATGEISEETLKTNAIPKNVITRSLGPNPSVQVDLEGPFPIQPGDRYLICSDGLSGQLSDDEIGVLLGILDIDKAVRTMIDLSNLRGGPDNITVVVAEIKSELMASEPRTTQPAMITRPKESYPLGFGIASAVCGLASVVLLLLGQTPLAIICCVAALVAGLSGWIKTQMNIGGYESTGLSRHAPYRRFQCKPTASFASQLSAMIQQLQEWIVESGTQCDQKDILVSIASGNEANVAKDYTQAIRHYCNAITAMMRSARANEQEKDDEAIDY